MVIEWFISSRWNVTSNWFCNDYECNVEKELIPFAILGYVLAAYLQLPVIGIALVGAVFAIKHYNDSEKKQVVTTTAQGGEQDDWI